MLKTLKRIFLIISVVAVYMGIPGNVFAQMPVTVAPQLIPPYSLQLSSYYQGATPRLMVTLINNDLNRSGLRVKMRMSIKGRSTGVLINTNPVAVNSTFVLESGIPVQLSLNDMVQLFNANNLQFSGGMTAAQYQQKGTLPEDIYDFCFEVFEAATGERLSNQTCATAYITFSEPPFLNLPAKKSKVKIAEPANVTFSWTPRHRPNPAEPTEYAFQIIEINGTNTNTNNPEAAFTQSKILYQEKTTNTSLLWSATHPLLIPGKTYAWRIKADNVSLSEDKSIFRNGGYSEISYFEAVPNCAELVNIVSNTQPEILSLTWTPSPGVNNYTVSYRKKGSYEPWVKQTTSTHNASVKDLEGGAAYEYTVSFDCGGYPVTSDVQTITIAKPLSVEGLVTWKLSKPAYDKVSYNIQPGGPGTSFNGKFNAVTPVKEEEELKGTATAVGGFGIVKLYFLIEEKLIDSVSVRTDDKGKYKAAFPKSVTNHAGFATGKKEVKVSAFIPGHTSVGTKTISVNTSSDKALNGDIALGLNTIQLFLITEHEKQNDNNIKEVEVYVQKDEYEQNLSFTNNKLTGTTIQYNGVDFVLVAKDKGHANIIGHLPKLTRQQYLLRTTYGTNVKFQLIDDNYEGQPAADWWMKNQSYRMIIEQIVEVKESVLLTGKVQYNEVPKADQTVTLSIKKGGNLLTQVRATTDIDGKYEIRIPIVSETGVEYDVEVRDAGNKLNNLNAPNEKINPALAKNGTISKNFNFDLGRVTVTGIVLDQSKRPLPNVLVKAADKSNTPYASVTTNKYGYYSFYVPAGATELVLSYESEETELFTQNIKMGEKGKALTVADWKAKVVAHAKQTAVADLAGTDPQVLGIHGNTYEDAYRHLTGSEYLLSGAIGAPEVTLKKVKGYARFQLVFKAGKGKAKIEFPENIGTLTGSHNEVVRMILPFNDYKLNIAEADKATIILPFNFTHSFSATDTGVTIIHVDDYVRLNGVVYNKDKKALSGAKVYIEGINREVLTDKNGAYSLIVTKNEAYTLQAVKEKHAPFSKAIVLENSTSLDITLEESKIPEVKTLAGFEFTLTDIKPSSTNPEVYHISGSLIPPGNDVFKPTDSTSALTFENQSVNIDTDGNAIPTLNLRFNETVYNLTAFDFASVEISDDKGIFMIGLKDKKNEETRAIGGITAAEITLKLKDERNISKTGLRLSDATIRNSRHKEVKGLEKEVPEVVFVPEEHKINSLQEEETFNVILPGSQTDSLLTTTLGDYVPAFIVKASGNLTKDGLKFEGGIGIPKVPGLKLDDNDKTYLHIEEFAFGENYRLTGLKVNVDDETPELAIQKIRAKLQSVGVEGIGTSNFGMSIGGYVYMKKPEAGGGADTLFIKEFKFKKEAKSVSVLASFRLGGDGVGVKGLSFSQEESDELTFEYDASKRTFRMVASGKLNYKSKEKGKESPKGKFSAELFPVEINRFEFTTRDWGFLIMASANAKVSLGVASLKLSKLLVSIGNTSVNKSEMMQFLRSPDVEVDKKEDDKKSDKKDNDKSDDKKSDKKEDDKSEDKDDDDDKEEYNPFDDEEDDSDSDAYEMVDEAETAWAIGIKGGVEFAFPGGDDDKAGSKSKGDAKGMNAGASAIVLVSYIDNSVQVDIDSIKIFLEKPGMEVAGYVTMQFEEERTGFAGGVKLVMMETGFDAEFGFYKLKNLQTSESGIELFANLKVLLGSAGIPTGPITWYGIGGGFKLNTLEQKFEIFAKGDFGTTGTPKESMYIKDATVKILFDAKVCGVKPVLQIGATLNITLEDWLKVTATADFCNALIMVTLDGQVPIIPKTELTIAGVLLAFADLEDIKKSAVFLAVNANVDVLDGLLKGNAFVGLGINVDKDHRLFIKYMKDQKTDWWSLIDKGALDNNGKRFHGININAGVSFNPEDGNFTAGLGFIKVLSVKYTMGMKADANMYFKFDNKKLLLELSGKANVDATVTVLVVTVNGKANVDFNFKGGYTGTSEDKTAYWYAKGDASVKLELFNNSSVGCGTLSVTRDVCVDVPSGVKWCDPGRWLPNYPCGLKYTKLCYIPVPTTPKFKLCVDKAAAFDYKQGSSFKFNLK